MSDRIDWILPDFGDFKAGDDSDAFAFDTDAPEKDTPAPPEETPSAFELDHTPTAESIAERSRQIAAKTLGETLRKYREQAAADEPEAQIPGSEADPTAASDETEDAPDEPKAGLEAEPEPESESSRAVSLDLPAQRPRPRFTMGEDGIITLLYDSDEPEAADAPAPEEDADTPEEDGAAEPAVETDSADEPRPKRARRERVSVSLPELLFAPFIRIAASRVARQEAQKSEAERWPEPEDDADTPELSPKRAAKYYAWQARRIRTRLRIALVLTVILAWIALGLPMFGRLGQSLPLQAGMSLILMLLVLLDALDIFSAGLRQLFDLTPGPESLASLSALLSCVDAALVLFGFGQALPFCAVGAAALTAALWDSRLHCLALMRSFRTAAATREPGLLASTPPREKTRPGLFRAEDHDLTGFVRRSESTNACRTAYAVAAPILLLAALALSIVASLGGNGGSFLHTLSALISVSASFSAFFGFSLPYAVTARSLRDSGAALAGSAGCEDIAKTKELVVTDEDLFPPGTMKFRAINILEGVMQYKVITAACSLIFASSAGPVALFEDLAARRGVNVPEPREYTIHVNGGVSGIVNGEHVDVGPARYMNLQGIRLPPDLAANRSVCVAIEGELVAVFEIEYNPTKSVQEALVTLLRSRTAPIFMVKDFNITPKMVHEAFKLPSTNFHFPPYRDRVHSRPEDGRPPDAVITRKGMLPYVEAAEAGRRLSRITRIITILSLIGSAIGMSLLFLWCRTQSFDTASAGNVLSFMILWSLPAVVLSYIRDR